jgi:hypothetical protein
MNDQALSLRDRLARRRGRDLPGTIEAALAGNRGRKGQKVRGTVPLTAEDLDNLEAYVNTQRERDATA